MELDIWDGRTQSDQEFRAVLFECPFTYAVLQQGRAVKDTQIGRCSKILLCCSPPEVETRVDLQNLVIVISIVLSRLSRLDHGL